MATPHKLPYSEAKALINQFKEEPQHRLDMIVLYHTTGQPNYYGADQVKIAQRELMLRRMKLDWGWQRVKPEYSGKHSPWRKSFCLCRYAIR